MIFSLLSASSAETKTSPQPCFLAGHAKQTHTLTHTHTHNDYKELKKVLRQTSNNTKMTYIKWSYEQNEQEHQEIYSFCPPTSKPTKFRIHLVLVPLCHHRPEKARCVRTHVVAVVLNVVVIFWSIFDSFLMVFGFLIDRCFYPKCLSTFQSSKKSFLIL